MPYTPNSVLKLYNVPWSKGDSNIRWFDTADERDTWHDNRTGVSYEALTTIKLGVPIKIHESYMNCLKYNYARFINPKFSNQYIYCYITNIEWGADETTYITLEEDNIQTWLDKFTIKPTFIERIHTKGDAVPLTPEPLAPPPTVRYTLASNPFSSGVVKYSYFCLASVGVLKDEKIDNLFSASGIYEGISVYYGDDWVTFWNGVNKLNTSYDNSVKLCFCLPSSMLKNISELGEAFTDYPSFKIINSIVFNNKIIDILKPSTLDDYTPRNKKCFTYPYAYLIATNYTGQLIEYRYENFKNDIKFTLKGRVGGSVSVECAPLNYENDGDFLNALKLEDAPKLGFSSSYFDAWAERNSVNLLSQLATAGINVSSGNLTNAIMTGVSIASQINQNSHNANAMSVPSASMIYLLSQMRYDFGIYKVSADKTYIERVDDFFQRYGYAYNKIGSINVHNRDIFVYVKTSDSTVVGAVPTDARNELKQKLDNGVTFWHTDDIGNYNVDNN